MSYNGGVHFEQGAGNLVVPSGKKITVQDGGSIEGPGFGMPTFNTAYFTVSDGEVTLKPEVAALLQIVANIPTTDPQDDGVTIWNDNGTLKVSGASGG